MPNVLSITVENSHELLNVGAYDTGALIQIQSSATETGTYADLTGTGATPTIAIVLGTRVHTGYDPAGTSTTWYRTRYKNSGATRVSDWSSAFQVAGEAGGYICSLYDAKQRLGILYTNTTADEDLLELIRDVTDDMEGYTERWLVPRETTLLVSPDRDSRTLWLPKGVRAVTSLGYATTDQPDTGGTYTTLASTTYSIQPGSAGRSPGWPGDRIALLSTSGVSFRAGLNTVSVTGSFGWSAPSPTLAGIAANAVVRRWQGKGSGVLVASFGSDDFAGRTLRWISPEERETLGRYRHVAVA